MATKWTCESTCTPMTQAAPAHPQPRYVVMVRTLRVEKINGEAGARREQVPGAGGQLCMVVERSFYLLLSAYVYCRQLPL